MKYLVLWQTYCRKQKSVVVIFESVYGLCPRQISNKTYMWGHCHGQSVVVPTETPFGSIHEVFASFAGLVTLSKLNYVCFFTTDGVLGIKEAIPHGVLVALKRHTREG